MPEASANQPWVSRIGPASQRYSMPPPPQTTVHAQAISAPSTLAHGFCSSVARLVLGSAVIREMAFLPRCHGGGKESGVHFYSVAVVVVILTLVMDRRHRRHRGDVRH